MEREHPDIQRRRYLVFYYILEAIFWGSEAIYYPYIGIYYDQIGFTVDQIGVLQAIGPIAILIFAPIFGYISDRHGRVRVFRIALIVVTILSMVYPASHAFAFVFPLTVVFAAFNKTSQSMLDGVCLEYSNATGYNFPVMRLMGTLGFALLGSVSAYLVGANLERYFPVYTVILAAAVLDTLFLPKIGTTSTTEEERRLGTGFREVLQVFKNRQVLLLLAYALVLQFGMGFYLSFNGFFIHENGMGNEVVAMVSLLSALSEIPVFWFFNKLVKRFGQYRLLLFFGMMVGIRILLTSFAYTAQMYIAVQLLQGVSFIGATYCCVTIMNNLVAKKYLSTGQTVLAMMGNGLGYALGAWLGGVSGNIIGMRSTFRLFAIILIGINLMVMVVFLLRWIHLKRTQV